MSHDAETVSRISDRRQELLRAASLTLVDKGYGDTRIADVAKRAGVSKALLIYYFNSREQLLLEALGSAERQFYEDATLRLKTAISVRERLLVLIDMVCEPGDQSREQWCLWIELWAQAQRHSAVAETRAIQDRRFRDLVAHVAFEGQLNGEVGSDVDPRRFAIALTVFLDGLMVQLALEDSELTPNLAREIALEYAIMQLRIQ